MGDDIYFNLCAEGRSLIDGERNTVNVLGELRTEALTVSLLADARALDQLSNFSILLISHTLLCLKLHTFNLPKRSREK